MVPIVKHGGGGVMVWGCMAASSEGKLVFIDGIMDHWYYINLLKLNLRPSAEKLGLADKFQFCQDNDPKHSALNTKLWLLYNCPKIIKTSPQSLELNPIEHFWCHLEKKIRSQEFTNINRMKEILQEEWNKIDLDYTNNLVKSLQDRLKEVIRRIEKATRF